MELTGIVEIDTLILLALDDKSLSRVASVSTYINSLLDDSFWASRFQQKYGLFLWNYRVSHESVYKDFSMLQGNELIDRVIDYQFIELLKSLLDNNNKNRILIAAANNGMIEVVKLLISEGADIHAIDDISLRWAIDSGHLKVVELLINEGANIHANYNEALISAVENGHLEIVKLLIDKGVDIHANEEEALQIAAENEDVNMLILLINRGANTRVLDASYLRVIMGDSISQLNNRY